MGSSVAFFKKLNNTQVWTQKMKFLLLPGLTLNANYFLTLWPLLMLHRHSFRPFFCVCIWEKEGGREGRKERESQVEKREETDLMELYSTLCCATCICFNWVVYCGHPSVSWYADILAWVCSCIRQHRSRLF